MCVYYTKLTERREFPYSIVGVRYNHKSAPLDIHESQLLAERVELSTLHNLNLLSQ